MSLVLADQVIVVTGGAGRIGRAFCSAIAQAGGKAIVADRAGEKAAQVAAELCNQHGTQAAAALVFDITSASEIDVAVERLHERYGRIDAVVNNAYPKNSGYGAKVEDVTYANFTDNVARHTGGYFITAQRFAAYFSRQGRGNIVFMSSIYGVVAPRFEIYADTPLTMPVEYAVIKAALLHLTRYLAQYYKQAGIRVNALSPGGVLAEQPAEFVQRYSAHAAGKRMLEAVDLASPLIFLLSPASAHITGQNLLVDDGWTL